MDGWTDGIQYIQEQGGRQAQSKAALRLRPPGEYEAAGGLAT